MDSLNSHNELGKVFVEGKASEIFTCDRITITITFQCKSVSDAKASETVTAQCERFLQRLSESGIDITAIRLHDDSIDQPPYRNDDKVKASRTLKFDSEANVRVIDFILKTIQNEHLDAGLSTDYYLSNEEELRKCLRKKAIEDSKENAELLACATGKKIVGVDTIDMSNHQMRGNLAKCISVDDTFYDIASIFSKRLSMPIKNLEEEIKATWLIG